MKLKIYVSLILPLFFSLSAQAQSQSLLDDFSTTNAAGGPADSWWNPGQNSNISVQSGQLRLNRSFSSSVTHITDLSPLPFCSVNNTSDTYVWTFNMFYSGIDPTGVVGNQANGAFMGLTDYTGVASLYRQGYAVVLGDNTTNGPKSLHFGKYTSNILTDFVSLMSVPVTPQSYMAIQVMLDRTTGSWYMGVDESLGLPYLSPSGYDVGPVVDTQFPIGNSTITSPGLVSNGSNDYALFDNIYVPACDPPIDPNARQVSFDQAFPTLAEGGTGVIMRLSLDQAAVVPGTVTVTIESDGQSSYGLAGDFLTQPAATNDLLTLVFEPGDSFVEFTVTPVHNLVFEPVEQVRFSISDISGALIQGGNTFDVITLTDDDPVPQLSFKTSLAGPYEESTGLMNDDLRGLSSFPLSEPFTALEYPLVSQDFVSIAPSVLTTSGPDAIVDWVLIEARDANDPTIWVLSRAALLQRDGDIVDLDGTSAVAMPAQFGAYHFAVRHRNHFGAMTDLPVLLHPINTTIDFTNASTPIHGIDARKNVNGTMLLWSGDVNRDGELKYIGQDNDRDQILVDVGGSIPTNTVSGYSNADINMDGIVKYVGQDNDRDPILVNIGGSAVTNVKTEQLPY